MKTSPKHKFYLVLTVALKVFHIIFDPIINNGKLSDNIKLS